MSISQLYSTAAEPASFSGVSTFRKNHKNYKLADIKSTLDRTDVYTLHKQVRRKFPRRKVVVAGIDDQWQVDLLDIKKLKYQNGHNTFILTCIDVFRRYGWAVPIKNKEAKTVRDAFLQIFESNHKSPPRYIYSDAGNEFKGVCRQLFKELNITILPTKSIHKASIVERFNRTLREKIYRYITWNESNRFIDALPDLVQSYNKTIHKAHSRRPVDINKNNELAVRRALYGTPEDASVITFLFKAGDYVRLVLDKKLFEKGSTSNWSKELYIVAQLVPSVPPTYKVKTLEDVELDWKYYAQELQKVSFDEFPFDTFKIIKKIGDKSLVVKVNSENPTEVLVDSGLLE